MTASLRIALAGPLGRMGKAVIAAADGSAGAFQVVQALGRPGGRDGDVADHVPGRPRGLAVTTALAAGADVLIDFSTPEGAAAHARDAAALGVPLVVCVTGLDAHQEAALDEASGRVPVLVAPNTSLGVAVLVRLVQDVARSLGPDYDVELVELHHRGKKDSPSGTALALTRALGERALVHGRQGKSPRAPGEVGVHALRLGDVIGEHRVYFAGEGERVELAHVATTRDTFARGALRAARWLFGRPAGRYTMQDVVAGR